MTRPHRSAHRLLWLLLTLALACGLAIALLLRTPAEAGTPATIPELFR